MAKELGETTQPKELVPGGPDSVTTTLTAMRSYGDALHEAGTGLKRINVADGWSGEARDAFREAFHGQPPLRTSTRAWRTSPDTPSTAWRRSATPC